MSSTLAVLIVAVVAAAAWAVTMRRGRLGVALTTLSRPASPVDEAERVLARRYARGSISAQEYRRMTQILRS
jgi:uncharacterized membrane protein